MVHSLNSFPFFLLIFLSSQLLPSLQSPISFPINYLNEASPLQDGETTIKPRNISAPNITFTNNGLPSIDINLGINNKTLPVILDISSLSLWVKDNNHQGISGYNPSVSGKETDITFGFNTLGGTASGKYYKDLFSFGNTSAKEVEFGVASNTSENLKEITGVFGLGRNYDDLKEEYKHLNNTHNLLAELNKQMILEKNIFSLKLDLNSESYFFAGDYANEILNRSSSGYCSLLTENDEEVKHHYGCKLTHLILGNNTAEHFETNSHELESKVYFDSTSSILKFPLSLNETLHKTDLFKNCKEIENTHTLNCTSFKEFPGLSFVFNGYALKINNEDLFTDEGIMNIEFIDKDYFILGLPFLKNYHTVFDNEQNILIFWNADKTKIGNVRQYTDEKSLFFSEYKSSLIYGILIFIGLMVYGGFRFALKKKNQGLAAVTKVDTDKIEPFVA